MKRIIFWLLSTSVAVAAGFGIASMVFNYESEPSGPRVGIVEVEGFISDAEFVVEGLMEYAKDPDVKAIVLRVNTPGGVVAPSQEIHDQVARMVKGKPVIASFGSVAASGGYYLSAPATKIMANPGSITGSIGVILQFQHYRALMDTLGLRFEAITSGEFKDTGSPFRDMSESEKNLMQGVVDDIFDQFVLAVAKGRNMEKDVVLKLSDGRIYTGRQAREVGLVDELGGFVDAVALAGELGGIEGTPAIVRWEKPKTGLLSRLLGVDASIAQSLVEPLSAPPLRYLLPSW
jgi:protease-4